MPDKRPDLLIVDDDSIFADTLARAMYKRGFSVTTALSAEEAIASIHTRPPAFALVDLKLGNGSGLVVVRALKELETNIRVVVLTGFASIATAVEAIKLGATHYLPKPADADEITAAFFRTVGDTEIPVGETILSVDRLEWEYIQRVLNEHQGNISATARALNMHRRTLQRKLAKKPVKQ